MQEAKTNLRRLNLLFLAAFAAVALVLIFWSVLRADWLGAREDNPRPIEVELRTQRGTIFDTNNQRLAWSEGEARVQRRYAASSGAAVGYYSFRFGAVGIEQGMDAHLRGTDGAFWDQMVRDARHEARDGRDVRLTIDGRWQESADSLLADQSGALVLISLPDFAIRTLASYPSFDPNLLDEQFGVLSATVGAPLLNRATQGVYQPGTVLQPFIYATAVERSWLQLSQPAPTTTQQPVEVDNAFFGCAVQDTQLRLWRDALAAACPSAVLEIGDSLTTNQLDMLFADYGFLQSVALPFVSDVAEDLPSAEIDRALIGQGNVTVTPLQVALAWAGLANAGQRNEPRLIAALESESGDWVSRLLGQNGEQMVSADAAQAILAALPSSSSLTEFSAYAIAGPDGSQNAWYLALAPAAAPRYALVVVLENSDPSVAKQLGSQFLRSVIDR